MSEIPEKWTQTSLGEVVQLNPKSVLDDELKVGFSPMAMIPKDYRGVIEFEERLWGKAKKGYTHFQDGDVLFAKVTPCFENGKAAFVTGLPNGKGAGSTEYFVLRPYGALIESKYLLALVKTKGFLRNGATNMTGSVGLKRVPKEFVQTYPLPLPPLAEQKEIAARLDSLLAQVDSIKTRLDSIPTILKRFRQSILAAAVSGRLVNGGSKLDSALFSDLIDEMKNGLSPKPNEEGRGYPILRISSVRSLVVDQEDVRYLECDEKTRSVYTLEEDDLLFTRYNGSLDFVGVCGRYQKKKHDILLYPDKLIRVRTKHELLLPKYAEIFFSAPQTRKVVTDFIKSTSGQKGISGKDLKSVLVNFPLVKEQTEIVRRVEQLFTFADQIEQRVKDAQSRVNNLTQSILAKAFRGELTADWREQNPDLISGENSAEALLEKIKVETSKIAPKERTRNRNKNKTVGTVSVRNNMEKSRRDEDVWHKAYLAGIIQESGSALDAEGLYSKSNLEVTEFYKQLAWEIDAGLIKSIGDELRTE